MSMGGLLIRSSFRPSVWLARLVQIPDENRIIKVVLAKKFSEPFRMACRGLLLAPTAGPLFDEPTRNELL